MERPRNVIVEVVAESKRECLAGLDRSITVSIAEAAAYLANPVDLMIGRSRRN